VDVNGTRFHLVLGHGDWIGTPPPVSSPVDVEWDGDAVRLRKLLPSFPGHHAAAPLTVDGRRGADRDRFGNWYWISDDRHEVRVSRMRRRPSTRFWSAADAARGCIDAPAGVFAPVDAPSPDPLQLAGLAVTTDHYLVVGRVQPAGLLIFDLRGGGAPLMLDWPRRTAFAPFDLSAAADGGVWVLDRDARALWRLDRHFRRMAPEPLPILETTSPIAVEALPDGSVLVLDDPASSPCSIVHRYRLDGTHFAVALDATLDAAATGDAPDLVPPLPLRAYDFAFERSGTTRPLAGTLLVAAASGSQAFGFTFASAEDGFSLALQREYLPMRQFTGKALVVSGGQAYYDIDERWIRLVTYPSPRFVRSGTITLPTAPMTAFDGKEARCVWHRLLIDGCIPYESAVTIDTRCADRVDLLADLPWTPQITPYRRGDGPEIPYYPQPVDDDVHDGTWELLLRDVVGRYLQVRLTISGTGRTSPRLSAVRIHYPRFSYLNEYLPAVYRDDPTSASFVERYLANVEGTLTTLEGRIEQVESFFDPRTAPADTLDWLAGWLGLSLDFQWSEATRRLFLRHAPQMLRERGTCAGLVRAIRLALDPWPCDEIFTATPCSAGGDAAFGVRVVERFRTRQTPGVVFGDPSELVGPGLTTQVSDWTPARGPLPLYDQYRTFLETQYADIDALNAAWKTSYTGFDDPTLRLAAVQPSGQAGADWQRFVETQIGFTYAVVRDTDEPLYREFLARRYGQPSVVNSTYHLDGSSALTTFDDVSARLWDGYLSTALPSQSVWLHDWIQFVSIVLPMDRAAHRFTVLVPVGVNDGPDVQLARQQIAQRITEIEKPAHTAFDVKLYWGLFRVGDARVGMDTLLGQGSRSVALVLDSGVSVLGAAHLSYTEPWNARDRLVVGREGSNAPSAHSSCSCTPRGAGSRGCGCQ